MFRTLTLAAALGALALPAAAASVTINVAGLDPKAANEKIVEAAVKACNIELRDAGPTDQFYGQADCVERAVSDAEARVAARDKPSSDRALAGL